MLTQASSDSVPIINAETVNTFQHLVPDALKTLCLLVVIFGSPGGLGDRIDVLAESRVRPERQTEDHEAQDDRKQQP